MPTLNGTLLEESCPDCLGRGKDSKLVEVTQDWDMEEEGSKGLVLKQCPCGYRSEVFSELPLIHEPSEEEIRALKGEQNPAYRIAPSFSWVFDYFQKFPRTA
ncbi:MAG: hypothetical protein WCK29_02065 [archaeon]